MIPARAGSDIELASRGVADTRSIGAAVSEVLVPGDVVSLNGDLGAGKTAFVQGAASALGVTEPIVSPTFVLVREYVAPVKVVHIDVYRLERLQEVIDLGFDEYLEPGQVIFVEWGDAISPLLPDERLRVELLGTGQDGDRAIRLHAEGRSWAERRERLAKAVEPWRTA